MNPASEATLAELLAVAKAQNVNLIKIQKLAEQAAQNGGGTGGSSSAAAAGMAAFTKSLGPAGIAVNLISGLFDGLSNVLSGLTSIIGKTIGAFADTIGNLIEFSVKAAEGTARLSDLYAAFKDLPLGLGMVASVFAKIVKYSETLLDTYRDITKSGASFSGNLFNMAQVAASGYMGLKEFATVIKTNSDVFATLSGNVDAGMRKFMEINTKMIGPNSQYSKQLLGLGYTAEESADLLGSFIRAQGNMNKKGLENNDQVAASVAGMAKELDMFAKITGQSREEAERALKKQSQDNQFKYFLQQLSPEKAADAMNAVTEAISQGGEGAGEYLKQMFMTNGTITAPLSDAAQDFYVSTQGQGLQWVQAYRRSVTDMKAGSEEQRLTRMRADVDIANSSKKFVDQFGSVAAIGALTGDKLFAQGNLMGLTMRMQGKTEAEIRGMLTKALKEQQAQATGNAAALAQAELNIKNFGTTLMGLVAKVLQPIANRLVAWGETLTAWGLKLATDFEGPIGKMADYLDKTIMPMFEEVGKWLGDTIKYLGDSKDMNEFWERLGNKLSEGAGKIWDKVSPVLEKMWDKMQPIIVKGFVKLLETLSQAIKDYFNIGETSTDKQWKDETSKALSKDNTSAASSAFKKYVDDYRKDEAASDAGNPESAMYTMSDVQLYEMFQKKHPEFYATPKPKAAGGPVNAGSYLVGEKGPEVLNVGGAGDVINNENLSKLLANAADNNNLGSSIDHLNKLTAQVLAVLQKQTDIAEYHLDATKALNNDLFA